MKTPRVKNIFKSSSEAAQKDLPLWRAWRMMRSSETKFLPVTDDGGRVVGLLHDRDILMASKSYKSENRRVDETMIHNPFLVRLHDPIESVIHTMIDRNYPAAIVVDENQQALGVFTALNALKLLNDFVHQQGFDKLWEQFPRNFLDIGG